MRIGVFDSGLGGLTVVQAMTQVIKGAQIFYVVRKPQNKFYNTLLISLNI
jgi:glutamate racemase